MKNKLLIGICILCAGLLIIPVVAFSGGRAIEKPVTQKTMTPQEAGSKVLTMVNTYFVQDKSAVVSGEPSEESGLYKVNIAVGGQAQPFYLTKDGAKLIFPDGAVNIAEFEAKAQKRKEQEEAPIPKSDKPTVELFVMSLCPYGVKAEKEILPVIKQFGDTVDFTIKYIVNVKGATINDVISLHGNDEAREDARQAAIFRYYPDAFGVYVEKMEKNACMVSCGALKLEDTWMSVAKELKMDVKKIEAFAYGQEGLDFLKQSEADGKKYAAHASPTLVINGVKSQAIYQGPEVLKQAICSAFTNTISGCQEAASTSSPGA